MSLLVEVRKPGLPWLRGATLTPGMPPGSISNNLPGGGRDVVMFHCAEDCSVISRSSAGADWEAGPGRVVLTAGTEELARLRAGESYEMTVTTDRGASFTVRWTHQ